jgi:MraZ protein
MAKFLGRFRHTLDHKGRVAIPARFRRALPPESQDTFTGVIIDDGSEKCITLYSSDEFYEKFGDVSAQSRRLPHVRRLKRKYYANALDFPLDPQGRIAVPHDLQKKIGLSKEVDFIGVEDTVEIWAPDVYEAYDAEGEPLSQLEYRIFGSSEDKEKGE